MRATRSPWRQHRARQAGRRRRRIHFSPAQLLEGEGAGVGAGEERTGAVEGVVGRQLATATTCESLIEFCSSIKELSVRVEEVQIPTVVQPAGVRGPAAVVMQTSALKIAPKRPAEDDEMDEAATKNNCYLCSLNGRALTECCILVPGSKPTQYLNGHNRKRAQAVCEWFDGKYKEGSAERGQGCRGRKSPWERAKAVRQAEEEDEKY